MMPLSAVWAGPENNDHLDGPPLIVTRTDGATPFRLVTHIGDVGHTVVAGTTGMGKSVRSEEHTSELQSLMRNSYAVFCLKKNTNTTHHHAQNNRVALMPNDNELMR